MNTIYGSEAKELRAAYNFGNETHSATNRTEDGQAVASPFRTELGPEVQLEDIHFADDASQPPSLVVPARASIFSRSEEYVEGAGRGADNGPGAQTVGQAYGVDADAVKAGGRKASPKKTEIMKEVLGLNKKSTKDMSEAEKQKYMLEKRWKNALAEEDRLNKLEFHVSAGEARVETMEVSPNFPPAILCIKPLVYHNLETVPIPRQRFVKMAFWNWVAVSLLLVLNMAITISVGFVPCNSSKKCGQLKKVLNCVLAVVYLIGVPLSFVLWYWPLYQACCTGRPPRHLVALCGLIVALAQSIFAFIGPLNFGVSGIFYAVYIDDTRKKGVVAPVVIVLVLWLAEGVFITYLLVKQFILYRLDLRARRATRRQRPNVIGVSL